MKNLIIFGARSSIGNNIINNIREKYDNINIYKTSSKKINNYIYFNLNDDSSYNNLLKIGKLDYVLWSHGEKIYDNINNFNINNFKKIMDINLNFILISLNILLKNNLLNNGSRLCIISSLLQELTNRNKLSYTISKSALGGLIRSVSVDLKDKDILINGILPGPIQNKMTMENITKDMLNKMKENIGFNRLILLDDVFNLFEYLCMKNNSTTGQSFKVDLGISINMKY